MTDTTATTPKKARKKVEGPRAYVFIDGAGNKRLLKASDLRVATNDDLMEVLEGKITVVELGVPQ